MENATLTDTDIEMKDENQATNRNPIQSMNTDTMKHMLSFCGKKDIAMFSRTSKWCYKMHSKFYLDTVKYIAWFDETDNCYHIEYISSLDKDSKIKNLMKMSYNDNNNNKYLLIPHIDLINYEWSMFIQKQLNGQELNECHGYWKILKKDNPKYVSCADLYKIRSLVLHKLIAPKLLNYDTIDIVENVFKSKMKVCIHDDTNYDDIRKYEILFWNGSDINQCAAFRILKCESGKKNYYMYFRSNVTNINWCWYDNNSSKYKRYLLGIDVEKQIECSFQANLSWNYPMSIQEEFQNDEEYFNNVSLNILKKAYIKQFGYNHNDKVFLLRMGYDIDERSKRRYIQNCEQLTVSDYGFPRSVQRINYNQQNGVNDFCQNINAYFNLRMMKTNII